MKDLRIQEGLYIPADELEITFSRSAGPGGQNVNKVNSKVTLKWFMVDSCVLSPTAIERLRTLAGHRLNLDGSIQVTSQEHRDQPSNLQACTLKLQQLIIQALCPPKPRKKTRPSAGSQRRRLQEKAKRSQTKTERGNKSWD
ncbi:MAG: alternative ribosome rescue aminoacyl-tRNA hydrolase ArfB [Pirellulaceae bacterium]|nr:alternative ribosome rescue aminoacyl-tRNA hydrolase ArfB [Pirellulaceae bacterium]